MDATRNPGDAEAAAAVEGMQDTYGKPAVEHTVGDLLIWRTPSGATRECRVVFCHGDDLYTVEMDGTGVRTIIDGRPEPIGHVVEG
jgi:hypothetical protein